MRGIEEPQEGLISFISLEERAAANHRLRVIRTMVNGMLSELYKPLRHGPCSSVRCVLWKGCSGLVPLYVGANRALRASRVKCLTAPVGGGDGVRW